MSKQWPEGTNPVSFDEIAGPIKEALLKFYSLKRKKTKGIEWTGLPLGKGERACCLEPSEWFSEEGMKEYMNSPAASTKREPIDVLIMVAIQLGIEQGRRMTKTSHAGEFLGRAVYRMMKYQDSPEIFKIYLDDAKVCAEELEIYPSYKKEEE